MNAGEGKSINKASKCKTATRKGPKQGLKSVDFSSLFGGLSHSKTVGRGFKSYCPCQKKDDCESNRLFSVIFAACATSYMHQRCVILPYGSDIALRAVEKANIISLLR